MKKRVILLFFGILLSISLISAIEIKSQKTTFSQGETVLFSIDGDVISPIIKEDIGFFEEHVQKPFFYDVSRIGNMYYIYTITPYRAADYSIRIENVYYKENNEFISGSLQLNFSVSNSTADFYVSPGFTTSNKDFSIFLSNNKNSDLDISYASSENSSNENSSLNSITISKQQSKSLSIDISEFKKTTITNLLVKSAGISYSLPVYIIKNNTGINGNFSNPPVSNVTIQKTNFKFTISLLNETLTRGDSYNYSLPLLNIGNKPITEINISVSDTLKDFIILSETNIKIIPVSSEKEILFTINPKKSGNYSGYIMAESGNKSLILPITLFIGEKVVPISSVKGEKSCAELGGKVCSFQSGQICSIPNKVSSDNSFCCLGECIANTPDPTNKGSNKIYIGAFILIILLIIGFLFWKYKKAKSLDKDILNDKVKKFSEDYGSDDKLLKD